MSNNTILATAPLTTTNYILKATGTTIGNSLIFDNGTNVGIGTASPVSTNLVGSQTIVKSYNSDTPTSTTAQTYYTNQSNLYLFGRNAGLSIISNSTSEEGTIFFGNASTVAYASIATGSGTSSVGGDMYFKVGSNTERMRISTDGSMGFGRGVLGSRSFAFQGVASRPIVIEAIENVGVHSIMMRPNNSGYNLISSNYLSGSVYLPLSLSGRENTSDFVLTTAGSVGINTTSPAARLQVNGAGGSEITFQLNDGSTRRCFFIPSQYYGYMWGCQIVANGGKMWSFGNDAGSEVGYIQINSGGVVYSTTSSDIRKKKNFEKWEENVLPYFKDINPQKFNFNIDKDDEPKTKGFIAQEMYDRFPEAYPLDLDGFHSFHPGGMVIYLTKAIQEMNTKLDEQNQTIQNLQEQINILAK